MTILVPAVIGVARSAGDGLTDRVHAWQRFIAEFSPDEWRTGVGAHPMSRDQKLFDRPNTDWRARHAHSRSLSDALKIDFIATILLAPTLIAAGQPLAQVSHGRWLDIAINPLVPWFTCEVFTSDFAAHQVIGLETCARLLASTARHWRRHSGETAIGALRRSHHRTSLHHAWAESRDVITRRPRASGGGMRGIEGTMRRFRSRRATELLRRFPELDSMCVIDLGGSPQFWSTFPPERRPTDLTLLNLTGPREAAPGLVIGDACQADRLFPAGRFDLVVSNSVLEHVGGHQRRKDFANAVHRLADRHWMIHPGSDGGS